MSVRSSSSRRSSRRSISSTSSSTSSEGIEFNQMINIEKKYPHFKEKSVKELEKLKSFLSEKQEFDQFIAVQTYIDFRKKENYSYVIATFKKWIHDGINEAAKNYDFNISQIRAQFRDQKHFITNEYDNSLKQLKEKHSQEIEKIQTNRSLEIDREKQRQSSDVRKLLSISQNYAHANEPEFAKKARNEAFLKQKKQFEIKQLEIDQKYNQMIKKIQLKYQNDSETIKLKYNSQLDSIKAQFSIETEEQKKKLLVFILYLQQRAINEGSRELIRKERKADLSSEITNYVNNLVYDIGKGFLFDNIES